MLGLKTSGSRFRRFFSTSLDVRGEVNLVRKFGDVDLEPVLDLVQDFGVGLVGDEGDGKTLKMIQQNYTETEKTRFL